MRLEEGHCDRDVEPPAAAQRRGIHDSPAPHEPDDAKPSPVATDAKDDDADTLRSEPRTDPAKIQEQGADLARRIKEKVLRDFANDPKEDARWLLREIGPSALDNIRAAISEVLEAYNKPNEPVTTSDQRAT